MTSCEKIDADDLNTSGNKNTVSDSKDTTYLVNEEGVIEKVFLPKEIKTKIHAEQILDYISGK